MRKAAKETAIVAGLIGVLCLIALVGIASLYSKPATPPSPFAALYKPPPANTLTYVFEPKKDMTAYELALSLQAIYGGPYSGPGLKPWYDLMPPEVSRHWRMVPPAVSSPSGAQEAPHPHPH